MLPACLGASSAWTSCSEIPSLPDTVQLKYFFLRKAFLTVSIFMHFPKTPFTTTVLTEDVTLHLHL